mgnify:CR=1 FL=1
MSTQYKFENTTNSEEIKPKSNIKVTDLFKRMNEEKKKEKKINLLLSIAAISAFTAFGIILSI